MAECGKRTIIEEDSNESLISPRNAMLLSDAQNLLLNVKESVKQNKVDWHQSSPCWHLSLLCYVNQTALILSQDVCEYKVLQLHNYKEQLHMDKQKSLLGNLTESTRHIAILQEEVEVANQITSDYLAQLVNLKTAFEDLRKKHDEAVNTLDERAKEFEEMRRRHSQVL